jgi:hypothetical protein
MFERKLAVVMGAWMATVATLIVLHWWQDSLGEGTATVWMCHTMGDRHCGPGEHWIKVD